MARPPLPVLTRHGLHLAVLLVLGLALSGPALAQPLVWSPAAETALDALAADPAAARAALGLPGLAPEPPEKAEAALLAPVALPQVETADIRVVLAQLAILAGANDHLTLLRAQSGDRALVLRAGRAGLADLAARPDTGVMLQKDGSYRLTRPLVVWQGAELTLGNGDRLALSQADGAFVLVFGRLSLQGATVAADAAPNPRLPGFRPFILAAGSAELQAQSSAFVHLGIAGMGLFAGVTHLSSGLFPPATPPVLRDNEFTDSGLVSLRLANGAVVSGNRFVRGAGVEVTGGARIAVSGNIFESTAAGSAIRIGNGARDVLVAGNSIAAPSGNGITIGGLARRVALIGNLIDGAKGTGIAATRASCLRIEDTAVTRGQAAGLRLSFAANVAVSRSLIVANRTAAVDLFDQTGTEPLALSGLLIAQNGTGLRGAGSRDLLLTDVDLSGQLPRLFAGDLAPYSALWAKAVQQDHATVFALNLPSRTPAQIIPAAFAPLAPTRPLLPSGVAGWPDTCLTE